MYFIYLSSCGLLKCKTITRNCIFFIDCNIIVNISINHIFTFCIAKHYTVSVRSIKKSSVSQSTSIRVNGDTFIEIIF